MPIGTFTPPPLAKALHNFFFQIFLFHFRCILLQISHQKCLFISISIYKYFYISIRGDMIQVYKIVKGLDHWPPPPKIG